MRFQLMFCCVIMLLSACQRNQENSNDGLPPTEATPSNSQAGVVPIERNKEAEMAFAAIGYDAWVFQYSGGEVVAEFNIFFQPAGIDGEESVVFEAEHNSVSVSMPAGKGKSESNLRLWTWKGC